MNSTAIRPALNRSQCCAIAMAVLEDAANNIGEPESSAAETALDCLADAYSDIDDCNRGYMTGIDCAYSIQRFIPDGINGTSSPSLWLARDAIRACGLIMEVSQ